MKRYVIFLVTALSAATGAGQNKGDALIERSITSPVFLAGEIIVLGEQIESLTDYLYKTVQYPKESVHSSMQGTEVIEFIVTSTGELKVFKILNSVCPKIDEEVIRAIKSTGGKWIPGTINGEPADMKHEVSVVFQLYSKREFINRAKNFAQKGNRLLFVQNNPEKALRYFNWAITFLPNEESLLAARGLCHYNLGDTTGAVNDWQRILVLAERNDRYIIPKELVTHEVNLPEKFKEIINKTSEP